MNLVWEAAPYRGNQLLTLLALADWCNDEGHCFPSLEKLARKSRQSMRSVQYAIGQLVDDDFLIAHLNQGRGQRNDFWINTQKLRVSEPDGNTQNATGKHAIWDTKYAKRNKETCKTQQCNKEEPSVEPLEEPSGRTNTPHGAVIRDWINFKENYRTRLSEDEYNLWLRPMLLLKGLSGNHLLLALPPNKAVVEAAIAAKPKLIEALHSHGLNLAGFTPYPEDVNDLPSGLEWEPVRQRIFNNRETRFVQRQLPAGPA